MGKHVRKDRVKGSQSDLRRLIEHCPELLNARVRSAFGLRADHRIEWVSPLSPDYAEYSDNDFLHILGLDSDSANLSDFWPSGGPHWDALAKGDDDCVFLVEAKAHIRELVSTPSSAREDSLKRIAKQLEATKAYLHATERIDWTQHFFQYGNRLAHLRFLRVDRSIPAFLIFLYFIGDTDVGGPSTKEQWLGAIELLHGFLGIKRTKLTPFVTDLFIHVDEIRSNRGLPAANDSVPKD